MIVPELVRLSTKIKMNSVYVVYILCRSKHENNDSNKRSNRRLIERILERDRKQAGNRSKRLDVYGKKKLDEEDDQQGKKNQKCGDFNDNTLEAEKKKVSSDSLGCEAERMRRRVATSLRRYRIQTRLRRSIVRCSPSQHPPPHALA
jgi:hypothetical protein